MIKIGVQVYNVMHELGQDYWRTLQRIQNYGFDSIEIMITADKDYAEMEKTMKGTDSQSFLTALTPLSKVAELVKKVKALGLDIQSCHLVGDLQNNITTHLDELVALSQETGIKHLVLNYGLKTKEECDRYAPQINVVLPLLRKQGITISYHNHEVEFAKMEINGETMTVYDYFISLCADDFMLQVDVGWVTFAGVDLIPFLEKYAKRVSCLHMKDLLKGYSIETREHCFAAIGEGVVKMKEVLAMKDRFPLVEFGIIIDQDRSNTDIFRDLEAGINNLRAMMQ